MKKQNKGFILPAHRHMELAEEGISYNRDIVKFRPFGNLKQLMKEKPKDE